MAAVVVSRVAVAGSSLAPVTAQHPKMTIVAEGGVAFTVPYAPREVSTDGFTPGWAVVDRDGRRPLVLRSGDGLLVMKFELMFGYADPQVSVENELAQLRALAGSGARLVVNLDATSASKRWRLSAFTQQVMSRQVGTNAPTRASCSLELTEVSDPVVSVGPVTGGAVSGAASAAAGPVKLPTTYIFKNSDTIAKISKQFYGDVKYASLIMDANKLRRGGSVIAGQKLTIPKKK